jgi:hypothetical protein
MAPVITTGFSGGRHEIEEEGGFLHRVGAVRDHDRVHPWLRLRILTSQPA